MIDHSSPIDVVRAQHWAELSDYLGIAPKTIRSTMKLWFGLLGELGYDLVATGANRTSPRRPPPAQTPPAPSVSYAAVYHAVEAGLFDVTTRRAQGERVSDQAETRTIATSVMTCLSQTEPESAPR